MRLFLLALLCLGFAFPAAAQDQGVLVVGQAPISNALTASDPTLPDDSHYDCVALRAGVGEMVTVTMRSGAFDTYLVVGRSAGKGCETMDSLASNDDMPEGGTDSQVAVTVGQGQWMVRANSLLAGRTGPYTLEAVSKSAASVQPATAPAPTFGSPDQSPVAIAYFGWTEDTLTERAREGLQAFVQTYRATGQAVVSVTGHTDTAESDMDLSRRRASAVRDFLVSLGIPSGQITVDAYGDERPAVETSDNVREPDNRRVEIVAGLGSGW